VRRLQQQGIEEMISRMQRELLAEGSVQASASVSPEEIQARKAEMEARQKFILALRDLKATGRMTVRLAHLRLLKGSEYDIELEDGDRLLIPARSSVVNVMGSVMSLGSYVFQERYSYRDYISLSGGYTRFADTDNTYVLKVDGSARRLSSGLFSWNDPGARWEVGGFSERIPAIEPGDTIIVPEKLDRIAWMRDVKDITQILMQMAVTAAVVIELLDDD
jgi:polysaccharide biosynthesis/export protein